jgi:tetratricopeptide (TPR) repeat protein
VTTVPIATERPAAAPRRWAGILAALLMTAAAAPADAAGAAPADPGLPPPDCVRTLRTARLAHRAGDAAAELAALRTAADAYPDEIAPTYALLEYHRDHGLPDEEHRRLEARLAERLGDPDAPLPLPLLRQVAGDPDADEELLRRLVDSVVARSGAPDGESADLLRLLADLQIRLGEDAEAVVPLARLWRLTGDTEVAWRLFGLYRELGRGPETLALMDEVEEMRENLWSLRVRLLAEAGRLGEALAEVDRRVGPAPAAVAGGAPANPDQGVLDTASALDTGIVEQLAWSFYDAGREDEAETLFRRALALHPGEQGLVRTLVHLFGAEDEALQSAAADIERQWQGKRDPQSLLDEGTQRLATGDAEGAFELLERAAPNFPDLEAPWFNLGMAASRLERWSAAADALGRAAELNPQRAASFFFRGLALVHLERCAEAVEALETALELDPERTQSHYYLAGCLRTLGRPEEAERHRKLYEAASRGG